MKLKIIYACENAIKKENSELQSVITKAANELGNKIIQYYESGIAFNNIYNAENVKYDKHGDDFLHIKHTGKIDHN